MTHAAVASPYVALGDGYAAGIGSRTAGQAVRRSGGYPVEVSRALGLDLDYVAACGSTVEDVLAHQVDAVGPDTALVTLTVGLGDLDLLRTAVAAARPRGDVSARIDLARRSLAGGWPHRYATVLAEIRDRSPKAFVVATGYPRLARTRFMSDAEAGALDAAVDELDELIGQVAAGQGVAVADPREAFAAQSGSVHGLAYPIENAFHPTRDGHSLYAEAVTTASLTGPRITPSTLRRGLAVPAVRTGPDRYGSTPTASLRTLLR